ncbi:MAG: hypothetical protein V3W10_06880 [candidate division NC10 bacterium]|jgi:hypothetical protein
MITVDAATMILLYSLEVLAYSAILLQLHRLDRRRLLEARCGLHQWKSGSPSGMVCSVCHKRVAQSMFGFPKINFFDRDWPLF